MPVVTEADVEEIALHARLQLLPEEVSRLQRELTSILSHMDTLNEVDTKDVTPMTHVILEDPNLRQDVVEDSFDAEVALAQAPSRAEDYFQVPIMIKNNDDG